MVFGRTKERRVPDLSRYDYHYKNRDDYNRSSGLSTAAAYAASKGAYSPAVQRSQPQRSHSMTHYAGAAGRAPGAGSAGVQRAPKSASGNYRSYSLRSQTSEQPARGPGVNNGGSRANSITVKTTEVRDPHGRTQSITRRTIKRENGYEYVETTTTTTQAIPIIDAEKHFDEFSGNYTIQDDGIEELSEEDQGEQQRPGHAYTALLAHGGDGEVPLDETSSISQFSDALDYMPNGRRTKVPAKVKRRPTDTRKSVQRKPSQQQPKKSLTEKEMYAKAYAIAQQNVYNSNEPSRTSSQGRQSRMGQRTLRNPAPEKEPSVAEARPRSSRISSFFQKANHNTEPPKPAAPAIEEPLVSSPPVGAPAVSAPAVSIPAIKAPAINVPPVSAPAISVPAISVPPVSAPAISAPAISSPAVGAAPLAAPKQRGSDEDMYAQALAIAQQKYGQTVEPPKQSSAKVAQEVAPRSNSDVEEQVSDVFERQEGTTVTKTTTPEVDTADPAKDWERYDAAHPEPVAKTTSQERKSKFKNMFDKVKQFSTENSGYQQRKTSQASQGASQPVESGADEVNIVSVAPLARAYTTSSHGASTTRNVETSLEQKQTTAEVPPSANTTRANTKEKKTKNSFFKKLFKRS